MLVAAPIDPDLGRLIAAYWRARASYDVGRRLPREVRIGPASLAAAREHGFSRWRDVPTA
jgi:hypothetical protein